MGKKAGSLLWNRARLTLDPGVNSINTGLTQPNRSFAGMSPDEPTLGAVTAPPGPPDGTLPASRIMVIPMMPLDAWAAVTHGEPFLNPATDTIWVTFNNATPGSPAPDVTINVLFWDPHSIAGPGDADTYNAAL